MNKSSIIEACKELNFKLTDDNTIYNLSNKIICNFIPNVKYQKIIDNNKLIIKKRSGKNEI